MNFQMMQLVVSAPSKEHWPANDKPEVVLAGRSNVGKSSLINTLCLQNKMAYVGNTPGKTRMLNFFDIDGKMNLVDVPGYGFANLSKALLVQFGEMMEDYFSARLHIKALVILLDARHRPTSDDLGMIEFATYHEIPLIYVVTKVDKCSGNELRKNLVKICETCDITQDQLILFSSKTRKGRDQLIAQIEKSVQG